MRKESNPLTPAEVAEILKISKYTVYEMVKRGELPAYRVGKKIRVDSHDLQEYINKGKGNEPAPDEHLVLSPASPLESPLLSVETSAKAPGLVICGQDICLDILGRHLEHHPAGVRAYRQNLGSFAGLLALYQDRADLAAIHLWDSDSNSYNIPYVRRLLPGIPAVVIHLGCRMQGFYVARGNPKNIKQWEDLVQPGIRFVNREAGSGTRVLIDEQFRILGINRQMVKGYENLEFSSLAVASAVSRGIVDVGVGSVKASLQVRDIDFIPLRRERYELVIKKEDINRAPFQVVLEILSSPAFKAELQGLGDYDLSETGKIVAEVN
jgi:putative molybdopterin biosynthesis protein